MDQKVLCDKIMDLLKGDALDELDLASKLNVDKKEVTAALAILADLNKISPLGRKPYHYIINDDETILETEVGADLNDIAAGTGNLADALSPSEDPLVKEIFDDDDIDTVLDEIKKSKFYSNEQGLEVEDMIVRTISSTTSKRLTAKAIAVLLGLPLKKVSYYIKKLREKGILKTGGKQPWHFILADKSDDCGLEELQPWPEEDEPDARRVLLTPKSEKKTEVSTMKVSKTAKVPELENGEFLIIRTFKSSLPSDLSFTSTRDKFLSDFMDMQKDPDLEDIAGYQRIKCDVVLTPKFD